MTVEDRMFLRDPIRARKSAPNHSYAKYSEDIQNSLSESQNEIFFKDFLRLLEFNKRSKRKKYRIWLPDFDSDFDNNFDFDSDFDNNPRVFCSILGIG